MIVALALVSSVLSQEVVSLTEANFFEQTGLEITNLAEGEPLPKAWFIKFFAPWCGHCINMAEAWKELAQGFAQSKQVAIGQVDCTAQNAICKAFQVRGYPTINLVKADRQVVKYSGERSRDAFFQWLSSQLQLKDL